jgi:transcriptional regulator with XRE-family HTH domain
MIYTTLTGRRYDLARLTPAERLFLAAAYRLFRQRPGWDEFSRDWVSLGKEILWKGAAIPVGQPIYRMCQDLASRLGIAEGRLARPDYRDRLADLIEERFGSRYRFCKQAGIDQGHLSRVLAGRSDLSSRALLGLLEALGVEFATVDREEVERTLLEPMAMSDEGENAFLEIA